MNNKCILGLYFRSLRDYNDLYFKLMNVYYLMMQYDGKINNYRNIKKQLCMNGFMYIWFLLCIIFYGIVIEIFLYVKKSFKLIFVYQIMLMSLKI